MRTQSVTKTHRQGLQESKTGKHTMSDGLIPLSGLSPSGIKQWVYALASDRNVGHDFTLPVACTVYAYTITHQGSSPGATGIDNNKAYDVGWTNTHVWIIAIGHA